VLRVIGRLNVGGPAQHVVLLNRGLTQLGYQAHLVCGTLRDGESSMAYVAERHQQPLMEVPALVTDSTLRSDDLRAVQALIRIMRELRPHVVHTHTSKAGLVGRLAAWVSRVPVVVHTYHGHVLHGYFPAWKNRPLRLMEGALARMSDQLIAVSSTVRTDLLQYRVASASKIEVVPLGLDLAPFERATEKAGILRRELGLKPETYVIAIVGRITKIKNHSLFLRATARVVSQHPDTVALVVGDGELRQSTEQHVASLGLGRHVRFLGWRRDLPAIYADSNVLVVSSHNEGTPVAAIEAMASGCPVVATSVGGVPDLITDGETGLLVRPNQAEELAGALLSVREHPSEAAERALRAQDRVIDRHGVDALVNRVDSLYKRLLAKRTA